MLRITIAALTIIAFAQPASAETTKSGLKGQDCYKFNQAGQKIYYPCPKSPSMQEELAAQQQMKANQPPTATTQRCHMLSNGTLACSNKSKKPF